MRRVIVPHLPAILTSVRAALPSARSVEREGRREPVWTLLATNLRYIVEDFVGEGRRFGVKQPRETRRRKRAREECRGGTGKRSRRLGMTRTCHRWFFGEGDSLEQSGENEELEGEKNQRRGKEKVDDA